MVWKAIFEGLTGGVVGALIVNLCRFLLDLARHRMSLRRAIRAEDAAISEAKECLTCDL